MSDNHNEGRPDRVFEVDSFSQVITDWAIEQPAIVSPPPPNCIIETCDSFQRFEETPISYPDDDAHREFRRGA